MSRFYAELHDRELLQQAHAVLAELQRRSLIDVYLAEGDRSQEELSGNSVFPRRFSRIATQQNRLIFTVEPSFFRSRPASAS